MDVFPWGNDFDKENANIDDTGIGTTSAVGAFPKGKSQYGLLDTSGNVWEWTRSLWGKQYGSPDFKYPYDLKDKKREDLNAPDDMLRVVRGGAFFDGDANARCAYRFRNFPSPWDWNLGFRLVASPVF